jgi:aldose 1-epimerase
MLDHETGTPTCVLQNQQLKLTVMPDNAYPILQLYIPDHRKSIAIENLSGAPDNFNNGIGLIQLAPNEARSFTTSYQVVELL